MESTGVTFANVIDVDPGRQHEVVELLREGLETVIQHRPGFVSAELLASKDGTRVVTLARWATVDDARATQADPAAAEFARRTAELSTPTPNVYDIVGQFTP